MRRTKAGLLLEELLNGCKHRWLFCWNGESDDFRESPYDCACCMTWPDEDLYRRCGCVCHSRIEEMANQPHIKMWLLAAKGMEEFPVIFHSEDEWLPHAQKISAAHEEQRVRYGGDPCTCEECNHLRTVDKRKASEAANVRSDASPAPFAGESEGADDSPTL